MRMRFTTAVAALAVGAAMWGAPVALADQAPGGPRDPGTSQARDIPIVTGLLQGLGLAPLPVAVPVVPTVPSTIGAGGGAAVGGSATVPGAGVPAVPVVPVPAVPTLPTVAAPTLPSVPALPSVPSVSGGAGAGGSVGTSGADAGGGISAQ